MSYLNEFQQDAAGLLTLGIHVSKASATVPQSTTQNIFTVAGGRVMVTALIGEVTTAIGAGTTPDISVSCDPTVGTVTVLASDAVVASDEVGTLYGVEGDGSALIVAGAGWTAGAAGRGFVVPPGVILITTTESTAGATKWDIWYQPMDPGASVVSA